MKELFFISMIALFFGCNMERNAEQDESQDHVNYDERAMVEGEVWDEEKINQFLREAAQVDKAHIIFGKMAQEKATGESVGIYGKVLMDDHTYSYNNLQRIVQGRQMQLNDSISEKFQRKISELEVAEGEEFDRKFLDMMVADHKKDIAKYENALTSIEKDNPVKEWIDDVLPALRRHLQKAQQLQYQQNLDTGS